MNSIHIPICRLRPDKDADIPLPTYMTPHAAGMDMQAAVSAPVTLPPGEITLIPTGFAIALPQGFEAQLRPRSGLAVKHGITLINAPGTIDSDYRGEIKIALINHGKTAYTIRRCDRIAQMIINRVAQIQWQPASELPQTDRGTGGFGHTGV